MGSQDDTKILSKTKAKLSKKKSTHLFMQNKRSSKISKANYQNLSVLYLQDNKISRIENLESAFNLTHLYLQNNQISKIENLKQLCKLKKLFLSHNKITVVENLEQLVNLEELHIERQQSSCGDALCFDPRTILALGNNLKILNVSHNNITSLFGLASLKQLRFLNAGWNKIKNVQELSKDIAQLYLLEEAIFTGNPVTKERLYAESIIRYTYHLTILDNKKISDNTRRFIQMLEENKSNSSKTTVHLEQVIPNISKNYPLAVQKEVSKSLLSEKPTVSKVSVTWKGLAKRKSELPMIQKSTLARDSTIFTHWQ